MTVKATYGASRPSREFALAISAAGLFVVALLCQLYGYESFPSVLSVLVTSNDSRFHSSLAALLVVSELLALPYLLGMYLSPLMRWVSAMFGIGVALFWTLLSLTNAHSENVGLFSDILTLPGGILPVLIGLLLLGAVSWVVSNDMRPVRHSS